MSPERLSITQQVEEREFFFRKRCPVPCGVGKSEQFLVAIFGFEPLCTVKNTLSPMQS